MLGIIGLVTSWPIPINAIALAVAFAPLVVSLLSVLCPPLIAPIDGRWWEMSTGGRPPEQDEREAFEHAFAELQDVDPTLRPPRHWFVAEEPSRNASAYASSLCVNRGLLESPYAAAVIAHEMGHLRSSDAHLTSALNLLLHRAHGHTRATPRLVAAVPGPRVGRVRAGRACGYRQHLGDVLALPRVRRRRIRRPPRTSPPLAQSLTHESMPHERSIRSMRFSRATHPYTKPRIARLHAQRTPHQGEH